MGLCRRLEPLGERTWRNEVSTSWLVTVGAFRPVRTVGRIASPCSTKLGEQDAARDAGAAVGAAQRTPAAELTTYPTHHFGVLPPDYLGVYADDAIDFLRRRVGLGR
jgi:hypothetical protein